MSLKQYSKEQLQEMSFIEIAYELLDEGKKPLTFHEILDEVAGILNFSEQEVKERIAQYYTDLNIDGRYLALGEGRWGLRFWYPVDYIEEETVAPVKPKKKKAKKAKVEDLDDYDEVEDEEDVDFDDLDEFADEDDALDDDEDFDDDDLDDTEDLEDDVLEDDEDYDLEDEEDDELDVEDGEEEEL